MKKSHKKTQLQKFTLMENAIDSLHHAVAHMTESGMSDVSNIKRAMLDVFHALELLLKEKLRRISPALVCRTIDKPQLNYNHTVSVDEAMTRLMHLEGTPLLMTMSKTVARCNKIRNDIMHYEFQIEVDEAKAILGKMLSLLFVFSKRILKKDLEADFRKGPEWLELVRIADFWKVHSKKIETELRNEGVEVRICPYCEANTFNVTAGSCALCGHDDSMVRCYRCSKVIWRGQSHCIDVPSDKVDEYFGGPIMEEVPVCEECYYITLAEDEGDRLAELEMGK